MGFFRSDTFFLKAEGRQSVETDEVAPRTDEASSDDRSRSGSAIRVNSVGVDDNSSVSSGPVASTAERADGMVEDHLPGGGERVPSKTFNLRAIFHVP